MRLRSLPPWLPLYVALFYLALCSRESPARAQPSFEDGDFAGWTTVVSGFADRTVSGTTESAGGNPGAHLVVRHRHEPFASFPTAVVSASFSPVAIDPGALQLAGSPRFSLDLRLELPAGQAAPIVEPTVTWVPLVEQSGVVYRHGTLATLLLRDSVAWVRDEGSLRADQWVVPVGSPPLDLTAGAAPLRIGVLLQTDYLVLAGQQRDALVHIDNVRVEDADETPAGPAGTADISVEICGTEFTSSSAPRGDYVVTFTNLGPETATGVVARCGSNGGGCVPQFFDGLSVDGATLEPGASTSRSFFVLAQPGIEAFAAHVDVGSALPDANPRNDSARMTTTGLNCDDLAQHCPLLSGLGAAICEARLPQSTCPETGNAVADTPWRRAKAALGRVVAPALRKGIGAVAGVDIEAFYRLRDDVMRATPIGRHAIELYETHGPEIAGLVVDHASLREQSLDAVVLWQGHLRALVDGRGGSVSITAEQIGAIEGVLDELSGLASPELRAVIDRERDRLDLPSFAGRTMSEALVRVQQLGCEDPETTLCLAGGRFRARVSWRDFQGNSGVGRALPSTEDSGTFWFFDPGNVELMVKVLDGRSINDSFWVFYGALSSVEFTLEVEDALTGATRSYSNPLGNLASVADVSAFPGVGELPSALVAPPPAESSCSPDGTRLCLGGNRFEVAVEWRDFRGTSGVGRATDLTSDTGTFWFFEPENLELVVKVLDGRLINGRFWVFYGALSNVEYTVTVRDRDTGRVKSYHNPSGRFASFADTDAF